MDSPVGLEDIRRAKARIESVIAETPLRSWPYLKSALALEGPVFLKLETLQRTGSFKVRGGANKILSLKESGHTPKHIVAASAGNHAQAVAFVSRKLGIPSTIVMPEGAPLVKAAATADYGSRVVLHGAIYDEAYNRAQEILRETPGAVYVHAYEDPEVIAGQGTIGLEIHEQLLAQGITDDEVQVVVPIGGGGLISGIAVALKALRPKAQVYGVVCEAAPSVAQSFIEGRVVQIPGRPRTLAEGLAVKKVSEMTFAYIKRLVSDVVVVSDDEIAVAITTLMERGKLVAEGAGAAGIAAALAGKFPLKPNLPTVFVVCGGNIDMNLLSNILERGFTKSGRWLSLTVKVEDRPGELAYLAQLFGQLRANVLEVSHDRISPRNLLGQTTIRFQLETRGPEHVLEIRAALEQKGYSLESNHS